MLVYICIFVLIVILRMAYYWERLLFLKKFRKDWLYYMKKNSDRELYRSLLERKTKVREAFGEAKVQQAVIPQVRRIGYGQLLTEEIQVLENFTFKDKKISDAFYAKLCEVVGYFKSRRNENINPLFWIRTVLFLPKLVVQFLGIQPRRFLGNLIQIVYWIVAIICAAFSREEIRSFIDALIE